MRKEEDMNESPVVRVWYVRTLPFGCGMSFMRECNNTRRMNKQDTRHTLLLYVQHYVRTRYLLLIVGCSISGWLASVCMCSFPTHEEVNPKIRRYGYRGPEENGVTTYMRHQTGWVIRTIKMKAKKQPPGYQVCSIIYNR